MHVWSWPFFSSGEMSYLWNTYFLKQLFTFCLIMKFCNSSFCLLPHLNILLPPISFFFKSCPIMCKTMCPFASQSPALIFDCGNRENHPQAALLSFGGAGLLRQCHSQVSIKTGRMPIDRRYNGGHSFLEAMSYLLLSSSQSRSEYERHLLWAEGGIHRQLGGNLNPGRGG